MTAYITFNNLISLDEITSVVVIDFYIRLYWTDTRLNVKNVFDKFKSTIVDKEGIEVLNLKKNYLDNLDYIIISIINNIIVTLKFYIYSYGP